jgi:UDP-glucose 4-epimerase
MGDFLSHSADNRDLNYANIFSEGEEDVSLIELSFIMQQGVEGMKKLL